MLIHGMCLILLLTRPGTYPKSVIQSEICSDPIRKNGYSGGPDPDPNLDFTDSADPYPDPDNEILSPDIRIRIRTYNFLK